MTDTAAAPNIVEVLIKRLPPGDTLSVPDVCVALDKHRDVVQGWIDSGEVDALDLGGGGKESWVIGRQSLCSFLRRRSVGIRAPAERRLENRQLDLFDQASSFPSVQQSTTPKGK